MYNSGVFFKLLVKDIKFSICKDLVEIFKFFKEKLLLKKLLIIICVLILSNSIVLSFILILNYCLSINFKFNGSNIIFTFCNSISKSLWRFLITDVDY